MILIDLTIIEYDNSSASAETLDNEQPFAALSSNSLTPVARYLRLYYINIHFL